MAAREFRTRTTLRTRWATSNGRSAPRPWEFAAQDGFSGRDLVCALLLLAFLPALALGAIVYAVILGAAVLTRSMIALWNWTVKRPVAQPRGEATVATGLEVGERGATRGGDWVRAATRPERVVAGDPRS